MLSRLYKLDHLYGLLLTFGLALIIEGLFRYAYGVSGQQYQVPEALQGAINLGFMYLPKYRAWVIGASLDCVFCDVVRDRAHQARAHICAPAPKIRDSCRRSASMCR